MTKKERRIKFKLCQKNKTHKILPKPHDCLSSTHIIIAPFVVLIFGLYVDGKLGQEGALEGTEKD